MAHRSSDRINTNSSRQIVGGVLASLDPGGVVEQQVRKITNSILGTEEQNVRIADGNMTFYSDAGVRTVELQGNKGVASGYASLDAGGKVVENPASATGAANPNSIPVSDGSGKLNMAWFPTSVANGLATLDTNTELVQLPPVLQGRTVVVPLTLTQLKTMHTTPELLISSPGANKAIIVDSIVFEANRTATAITGGGAISIKYASGADVCATIPAALLTGAAGTEIVRRLPVDATAASANISANALVITNADAVFADGAGTESANVWIQYRIISTTA